MPKRPIVLLHGYSDNAESLEPWRDILTDRGYATAEIHLGQYISLSNEITIKDLAEGFDRALRVQAGLETGEEFDAIVHSTGGLVIREWLATYATRRGRVKRIIGLAPAMFGSPLAHKGRSWLGAIFKGEKEPGPDFMEAGTHVLTGLEMGSSYTWGLAERDLLGERATYGEGEDTPYPFIFIGQDGYGGLRGLFTNPDGSDGTVRWAAAGLSTRKLIVDLRQEPGAERAPTVDLAPWSNVACAGGARGRLQPRHDPQETSGRARRDGDGGARSGGLRGIPGVGRHLHRSRLRPRGGVGGSLVAAVRDPRRRRAGRPGAGLLPRCRHAGGRGFHVLDDFALEVHQFTDDPSYRCFHVDLTKLRPAERDRSACV